MIAAYLYGNAALYAVFAAWCTIARRSTSRNLGYEELSSSGHSEYLVVYGGLQLGLAAFFAYVASQPSLHRAGLVFALALYVPIVVYRAATVLAFWPVRGMTLGVAALEAVLLVAAIALYLRSSSP